MSCRCTFKNSYKKGRLQSLQAPPYGASHVLPALQLPTQAWKCGCYCWISNKNTTLDFLHFRGCRTLHVMAVAWAGNRLY